MNFKTIYEFVETHQSEFSNDELNSLSFLCDIIVQDRDYFEAECGEIMSHHDICNVICPHTYECQCGLNFLEEIKDRLPEELRP